jgi:hypothetical protein
MKSLLAAFIIGLIFSVGLGIGGMTQPDKIIGFLNITGDWDPALLFVMGGALAVSVVTFRFILKRPTPLLGTKFYLPGKTDIDAPLLAGSALFGIGWGVGGYCPGPALVSLVSGNLPVLIFVAAMGAGMWLQSMYASIARKQEEGK